MIYARVCVETPKLALFVFFADEIFNVALSYLRGYREFKLPRRGSNSIREIESEGGCSTEIRYQVCFFVFRSIFAHLDSTRRPRKREREREYRFSCIDCLFSGSYILTVFTGNKIPNIPRKLSRCLVKPKTRSQNRSITVIAKVSTWGLVKTLTPYNRNIHKLLSFIYQRRRRRDNNSFIYI